MKTFRKGHSLLALTATAALFLTVVGSTAASVAAQDSNASQSPDTCIVYGTGQPDETAAEATQTADTDQVQSQDQPGEDTASPETDQVQEPTYSGSITVDQAATDALTGSAQCDALSRLATITPDQAKAAVEKTGGVVVSIELNDENGALVYSVQLQDGTDVKVDAGNGSILNTQAAGTDNSATDGENAAQ